MNKADKLFIMIVAVCACLLYVPLIWSAYRDAGREKEVVVSYKDREILRKSLSLNDVYTVKGTLGDVQVEVKDKRVRVEKDTSPNHLWSIQGWVEDANRPIVCLPNNIVVQIEAGDVRDDDVDTVIQ